MERVKLDCSHSEPLRNMSQNCRRNSGWYELLVLYHPRSTALSVTEGLNELLMQAYVLTYWIHKYISPKSFKLHLINSTYNHAQNIRNSL